MAKRSVKCHAYPNLPAPTIPTHPPLSHTQHTHTPKFAYTDTHRHTDTQTHTQHTAHSTSTPPTINHICPSSLLTTQDCNDNAPQFTSQSYFGSVSEGTPAGTTILTVEAKDADSLANGTVTYSLVNSTDLPFDIYPSSGIIYVNHTLDRERQDEYVLTVMAADGDRTPMESTVQVFINVTDVNDLKPVFDQPVYTFNVSENSPGSNPTLPAPIGEVHATDGDVGMNAKVHYYLATNTSLFSVDSVSGVLSVTSPLDREGMSGSQVSLQVIVVDEGSPVQLSSTCTVNIKIIDINDNRPVFTMPPQQSVSINVAESRVVGSLVYTLHAQDSDVAENGRVTYDWAVAMPDRHFELNNTSGEIRLKSALDFEDKQSYQLMVKAEDHGQSQLTATATITINVVDVNDITPHFLNGTTIALNVLESLTINSLVAHVVATDAESVANGNGRIEYSFASGNNDNTFSINRQTGSVFLAKPLNQSLSPSYNLVIQAQDSPASGARRSATLSLRIAVLPFSDTGPYFPVLQETVSVLENVTVGHLIAKIHANDRFVFFSTHLTLVLTFFGGGGDKGVGVGEGGGEEEG